MCYNTWLVLQIDASDKALNTCGTFLYLRTMILPFPQNYLLSLNFHICKTVETYGRFVVNLPGTQFTSINTFQRESLLLYIESFCSDLQWKYNLLLSRIFNLARVIICQPFATDMSASCFNVFTLLDCV